MNNHIAIGIDPAFRKSGFTVSIRSLAEKSVRFKQFEKFFDFFLWAKEQSENLSEIEGCTWSIGIENSYLVKKYFDIEKIRNKAELVNRIGSAAMNRAVSQVATEAVQFYFGRSSVWQFRPLARGKDATGGKKPHIYFQASVKMYGLSVYDYPKISPANRSQIRTTKDQDMRDAFFVGELALTRYRMRAQTKKTSLK